MRQPAAPRRPGPQPRAGNGEAREGHGERRARAAHGADLVLSPEEFDDDAGIVADDDDERSIAAPRDPEPRAAARPAVSQLEDRLAERRRSARRVAWIRIGAAAGVFALVAFAAWLVAVSPVLALRADRVVVEGDGPYLDRATASAVVAEHVGTPLIRLDTAGIAAEIAQAPGVAEAAVERAWPGGVAVTLTPREPVAVADAGGEQVDLVGADGVVVVTVPAPEAPAGLPLLTVDMGAPEGRDSALAVLSVLDQLPPELRERVRDAGASSPEAIQLWLDSGAQVVWGSAAQSDLKAAVLLTLLTQVEATRYDVSAPEAPTTS